MTWCRGCNARARVRECVERDKSGKMWLIERCLRCGERLTAKKWTKDGVKDDD